MKRPRAIPPKFQVVHYRFPNGSKLGVHRLSNAAFVIPRWSTNINTPIERSEAAQALLRYRRETCTRARPKPVRV